MRLLRVATILGLCLALGLPAGIVGAAEATVPAVWKAQHVAFVYMGRTARYSCDGLRDKVRAMLLDMGARRDMRVVALGCDFSGRDLRLGGLSPSLSIDFSSPALADAAARALRPNDLAEVEARFEPFTITSDAFRNMGIGDCELVEEFAHQILPKLATRSLKQDITCIPYQLSGSRYWVRGEVLRPMIPKAP